MRKIEKAVVLWLWAAVVLLTAVGGRPLPAFAEISTPTLQDFCYPDAPNFTPDGYARDITCPPQPPVKDGVCEPKCPAGWGLAPNEQGFDPFTGRYACTPATATTISGLFYTCYYTDPDCANPNAAFRSAAEKAVEMAKVLEKTPDSYVRIFLGYFTLDPKYLNAKVPLPLMDFIYQLYKLALEYARQFAVMVSILAASWFGANLAYEVFTKQARPDHLRLAGRITLFFFLFFAPTQGKAPDGTPVNEGPLMFKVAREFVYFGDALASSLAQKLNYLAAIYVASQAKAIAKDTVASLDKRIEMEKQNVESLRQDLQVCWHYYGECTNFLVPDDELESITLVNQPNGGSGSKKDWYYSRRNCREIEKRYKTAVALYNSLLNAKKGQVQLTKAVFSNYNFKGIFENPQAALRSPESYGANTNVVKLFAEVAMLNQKLGWLSFPLITMPATMSYLSVAQELKNLSIDYKDPNAILKAIGFLTLPPGKDIFETLNAVSSKATSAVAAFFPPVVGKVAGVASSLLAAVVSYFLTKTLLSLIFPLAVGLSVFIRTFMWLLQLAIQLISSPVMFIHAFRQGNSPAYDYLKELIGLAAFPLVMVFVAGFAYPIGQLLGHLSYAILSKILTTLADVGLIKIMGSATLGKLAVYAILGVVFVITILAQVFFGVILVFKGVDEVYRTLRHIVGQGHIEGTAQTATSQILRHLGTPI